MSSNDATKATAAAGPGFTEGLGPAPTGPRTAAAMTATLDVCGRLGPEHVALVECCRELERDLEAMRSQLPRLPTPRVLASGTIAGKRIELRGWHTEDIEVWERQHGLKFGA